MNLRAFYKQYELELIPVALENLTLGKCVWDGGWFDTPSFTHNGMPDYIYNTFVNKDIISIDECDSILDRMRALPKIEAAFAKENIEFELSDILKLKIAEQIDLKTDFDLKSIKSFSISNAVGKALPNKDRLGIDIMLDQIKDKFWKEYKSGLRRAYMITELYYGKIEIAIDTDLELSFEASLPNGKLDTTNKLKLGSTITYEFESSKVPFAMRIERVKQFNS